MFKMKILIYTIKGLVADINFWLSTMLVGFSLTEIDLAVKFILGMPGAIYLSLKIYKEFFKKIK